MWKTRKVSRAKVGLEEGMQSSVGQEAGACSRRESGRMVTKSSMVARMSASSEVAVMALGRARNVMMALCGSVTSSACTDRWGYQARSA